MSSINRDELLKLCDVKRSSQESRQGDRALIKRDYDDNEKAAFVTKKYTGTLGNLQKRENELLFHVRQTHVVVNGITHHLHSRIGALHQATSQTVLGNFEISVRWHGFDLMDWGKLYPRGDSGLPLMQSAEFLLALARSTLKALHLMHMDGLVHCDIKADNMCLPWKDLGKEGSLAVRNGTVRGELNPDDLKIIDLGLTLKRAGERGMLPDLGGEVPHPANHAPRLVKAYREFLHGRPALFEGLDWRVDLWALGHMLHSLRDIANKTPEDLYGPQRMTTGLGQLIDDLKACEGDFDPALPHPAAPADLPHTKFIKLIDGWIGPADKHWAFSVAGAHIGPLPPEPPTIPPPPWEFPKRAAIAVLGVAAAGVLAFGVAKFIPPPVSQPAAATQASKPMAGPDDLLRTLSQIAADQARQVKLTSSKESYRIGEPMRFELTSPVEGYLTLMFVDAGAAMPEMLAAKVHVYAGQRTFVPQDSLVPLQARGPYGPMRVAAIVSAQEKDWVGEFKPGQTNAGALAGVAASAPITINVVK